MKNLYSLFILLSVCLFFQSGYAQGQLWGISGYGGAENVGVIFKTNIDGTGYLVQKSFAGATLGENPHGNLIQASNGKMYGTTRGGGTYDMGVLFEYDPAVGGYTKKMDFESGITGAFPMSGLTEATDGKLYGMTLAGGANNDGVLFVFDPATGNTIKKLDFASASSGQYPDGSLTLANGKLYGMTSSGGANNNGVLFEYDPITENFVKKLDFSLATSGSSPYGSLIQATNGKLYGMTSVGGVNLDGVIFEYNPANGIYEKKFDFDYANSGAVPYGSLTEATDGKLYGMTVAGGANSSGVLFEFDPVSGNFVKKFDFDVAISGAYPKGNLTLDTNGILYGMTNQGGANNLGVLFEFDPSTSIYAKKMDFASITSGKYPKGSLIQATNGKLYGLTSAGGINNAGVLFEYNPTLETYLKKFDFVSSTSGANPSSNLIQVSNGKLYGITSRGGTNNEGVLFEYDPATQSYAKKVDFASATSGVNPRGVMQASNGKLYGVTNSGGVNNEGVLFEYDPVNGSFVKKLDFASAISGQHPEGNLIQASDGKLYGMTGSGGVNNAGVLFEFDLSTSSYSKKFDFDISSTGVHPSGSLTQNPNGKMYGMVLFGINNQGTLFEYDPITSDVVVKLEFAAATSGSYPNESLTQSTNGKMYGTTRIGGANNEGVLFEFDPSNANYSKKLDFSSATSGAYPLGSLTQVPNGKLYGTTNFGGVNNNGVLFEYDPTNGNYVKKLDFAGNYGANLVFIKDSQIITFNPLTAKTIGDADFNLIASSSSGLPLTYSSSDPTVAVINGITVTILKAGTTIITASQAGDASTNPAIDVPQTLVINKASQTITFNTLPIKTFEDIPFTLTASSNSGLAIMYSSSDPTVAAINGKTVTILKSGTTTITASQSGDAITNPAIDVPQTLVINKANQTITFNTLPAKTFGDAAFDLPSSSSAGLAINYASSNPNVATINGTTVTIIGAGTATITSSQAGNNNYSSAANVDQILTVTKANQTITFGALPPKTFGDTGFSLAATSTSLLPVNFTSSNSNVVTISGNTVTIAGGGSVTVTASQAGNNNYQAATVVEQSLVINKANQTITFAAIVDKTLGDPAFTILATTSSGLTLSYVTVTDKIAIAAGQATILKAGRETIEAMQTGNANYNAATKVTQSFCIKPTKPNVNLSGVNTESPNFTSSALVGNQWFKDGIAIDGATNATLSATAAGVYKVQVKVDDCISEFSSEVPLIITGDLSPQYGEIVIYPNPVEDYLELNGIKGQVGRTQVFDMKGQTSQLTLEKRADIHRGNVQHLSSGVYLLRFQEGNAIRQVKFIKK